MPSTRNRVPSHTEDSINRRLRRETDRRVDYYSRHKHRIDERLRALDREWDIERAIELNASTLALAGTALGITRDKRWLALPLLVTGFLFQHAVQGWCPPVPVLRRLGFRTSYEIDEERQALKALRGDFADTSSRSGAALRAART